MTLFLLGSGFSRAIHAGAPLNHELFGRLLEDPANLAFHEIRQLHPTEDIEVALTSLDLAIATSDDGALSSLRRRAEAELSRYFWTFPSNHELIERAPWAMDFASGTIETGDTVVSLNYDCIIEGILDTLGKWSVRGGYGEHISSDFWIDEPIASSPVRVLKIHGSCNFVLAPYADNPSAEGGLGVRLREEHFPRSAINSFVDFGAGTGRDFLIAPSYVKVPSLDLTYLMLDALTAASEAHTLAVLGCSLRPEDTFLRVLVTRFLRSPNWHDRRLVILDPAARTIREKLLRYWGVRVDRQIVAIEADIKTGWRRVAACNSRFG